MAVMKSENERTNRERAKSYFTDQEADVEREEWERLLLEDEETFASYIKMLDEVESNLPSLENSSAFVEKVMEDWAGTITPSTRVEQVVVKEEETRRYRWYEKSIFHYAVAASLTLLIMSSGMFDKLLTGEMELIVPRNDQSPTYTYTEQMMHATSGWLDQIMDGRQ